MTAIIGIALVALIAFTVYAFSSKAQQLFHGAVKVATNDSRAPHEKWPEILHWQQGDEFETRGWEWYSIYLISLTETGGAYCNVNCGHTRRLAVKCLVGTNVSLRDREMNEQLKGSNEYMELIKQFNIAYAELEARDRRNGIAA